MFTFLTTTCWLVVGCKFPAGHLSDDEMVETPMPAGGRVRKMTKHRRQLKAAEVVKFITVEYPAARFIGFC